jgi:uncharacterized protein (DUF736 family)
VVLVLATVIAACGDDDDDGASAPAAAAVDIVSPADETTAKGNIVTLDLAASDIEIVKADGDTSGKSGHFHVFVDKEPVAAGETIPVAEGIVHSTDDPLKITGLTTGKHTITVVLGDGTHKRIGTAQDSVAVTVDGPSLNATAPATLAAGQPLSVDVAVQGVELVKADGDTSGRTGHLHVFIDKEPTAGQTIPVGDAMILHSATAPISITGLAAGPHTIWVVLGNGNHIAFDPLVADKLTVTVS